MTRIKDRLAEIHLAAGFRSAAPDRSMITPGKLLKSITAGTITMPGSSSVDPYPAALPQIRPLVLTFRTVEERRRRVRLKAVGSKKTRHRGDPSNTTHATPSQRNATIVTKSMAGAASNATALGHPSLVGKKKEEALVVDMRFLHESIFVFVRPFDALNPPYRIENRGINHAIYFRQRGCDGHPWNRFGSW